MLIVVKVGGSILEEVPAELVTDIKNVLSEHKLVLVHGGGKGVTAIASKLGKEQKFVFSPKGFRSPRENDLLRNPGRSHQKRQCHHQRLRHLCTQIQGFLHPPQSPYRRAHAGGAKVDSEIQDREQAQDCPRVTTGDPLAAPGSAGRSTSDHRENT